MEIFTLETATSYEQHENNRFPRSEEAYRSGRGNNAESLRRVRKIVRDSIRGISKHCNKGSPLLIANADLHLRSAKGDIR